MGRKKRPSRGGRGGKRPGGRQPADAPRVKLRKSPEGAWQLAPPPCVRQRAEDMEEVHAMLDAGELDVARDEILWLLEDCGANIEAHRLLGELAASDSDWELARGHFGFGYELGQQALGREFKGTLPFDDPANRDFHECARGLAWTLRELGEDELARKVAEHLVALDPSDPLGVGPEFLGWPRPEGDEGPDTGPIVYWPGL